MRRATSSSSMRWNMRARRCFPLRTARRSQNSSAYLTRWEFDLNDNTNTVKRTQNRRSGGRISAPRRAPGRAFLPPRLFRRQFEGRRQGAVQHHRPYRSRDRQAQRLPVPRRRCAGRAGVRAARSGSAGEGDGFLVTTVYRGAENRSDFVVFDACHVAAGPIATAKLPRRMPFGFHGNWAPVV